MKEDIKNLWVNALRSDAYRQGKYSLQDGVGFCCLGVLSDLYMKNTGEGKWVVNLNSECKCFDDGVAVEAAWLTLKVREWAGMDTPNGYYSDYYGDLSGDNDKGKTFREIADIIEANWEQL